VSALLIADFLPAVAVGLLLGPLIDRFSRRGLMIQSDLVRLGAFVALIFADSATTIVVLAAVVGFATGFFRPASFAGLPNLVDEADLPSASSLLRSTDYLTTVVGTLLGGIVAATVGPDVSYGVNAVTFGISAVLLAGIPAARFGVPSKETHGHWRDVRDGFALIFGSRALLAVFVSWNLVMFSNASVNVSEVLLAKVSFDSGDFGYGLLWCGSGIGMVLGSLYAPSWLDHRSVSLVYGASLSLMSFGYLTAAISPNVWVATLCLTLAGSGNGAAVVCNYLLVQRGSPDHLRGRALAAIMSVNFALLGIGMAVAGPITDAVGARWMFGIAAAVSAGAALLGRVMTRGIRSPATGEKPEPQPAA
jgi:MFS family permease